MKAKNELEFLALIAQDFISSQPRSSQIALSERAQHCVNVVEAALKELEVKSVPPVTAPTPKAVDPAA